MSVHKVTRRNALFRARQAHAHELIRAKLYELTQYDEVGKFLKLLTSLDRFFNLSAIRELGWLHDLDFKLLCAYQRDSHSVLRACGRWTCVLHVFTVLSNLKYFVASLYNLNFFCANLCKLCFVGANLTNLGI